MKNKPSVTALSVAEGLMICANSAEWKHLVDENNAQLTNHFVKIAMEKSPVSLPWLFFKGFNHFPSTQKKIYEYGLFGRESIGYPQHIAMRKLLIEQQVRKAIAEGKKHVLILGGGYDSLALRLHQEFPAVNFYELDKGPTHEIKMNAIKSLNTSFNPNIKKFSQLGENLHFIECDLSDENWHVTLLNNPHFNQNEDAIVIAEGLTMYLPPQKIDELLDKLNSMILNSNGLVLLSFSESTQSTKLLTLVLKHNNESYHTAKYSEEVLHYANEHQYSVIGKSSSIHFQEQANNQTAIKKYQKDPRYLLKEDYYMLSAKAPLQKQENIDLIPNIEINVPASNFNQSFRKKCV